MAQKATKSEQSIFPPKHSLYSLASHTYMLESVLPQEVLIKGQAHDSVHVCPLV